MWHCKIERKQLVAPQWLSARPSFLSVYTVFWIQKLSLTSSPQFLGIKTALIRCLHLWILCGWCYWRWFSFSKSYLTCVIYMRGILSGHGKRGVLATEPINRRLRCTANWQSSVSEMQNDSVQSFHSLITAPLTDIITVLHSGWKTTNQIENPGSPGCSSGVSTHHTVLLFWRWV